MINVSENIERKVFVIFELSADGTILYFRNSLNAFFKDLNPVGRNFFEMDFFEDVQEFWRRFNHFLKGRDTVENFNFTLKLRNHLVQTRVMLMRVIERSNAERAQSIIVDIRSL